MQLWFSLPACGSRVWYLWLLKSRCEITMDLRLLIERRLSSTRKDIKSKLAGLCSEIKNLTFCSCCAHMPNFAFGFIVNSSLQSASHSSGMELSLAYVFLVLSCLVYVSFGFLLFLLIKLFLSSLKKFSYILHFHCWSFNKFNHWPCAGVSRYIFQPMV